MTTGTAHAQVLAIIPLVSAVNNSLERLERATVSAASCAKSGAAAIRAGREALAGARVERAEKLLVLARGELSNAIRVLHRITTEATEATGETEFKPRWDVPPVSWWIATATRIRDHAKRTLEMAESTQLRWNEKKNEDAEYGRLVARMEKDARLVQERWKESMRETQAERDIAEAVGDGLPSSHSVARVLPL